MTDIIELAKQWLNSDEGKQSLNDAIENAKRMNQQLEKARQIPTHLMHEPFVPVLTEFIKFAILEDAKNWCEEYEATIK